MGQARAQFRHVVAVLHVLAGEVVELVQVLAVRLNDHAAAGIVHVQDGLEHDAGTFLDELAHGVKVGRIVYAGRENAGAVLALGLTVELLPPFGHVGELGIVVHQDFRALAALLEQEVAHGGINHGRVGGFLDGKGAFRFLGTVHQVVDVKTGDCDGQEAHRGEDAESATHIVRNNEGLVAFLAGEHLEGAALRIRNGDDALGSILLSVNALNVLLHHAESHGGLSGGAALGNDDAGHVAFFGKVHQFRQVFFRQVVAGEHHFRCILVLELLGEAVAQGFDNGLGAQVAAADADGNHQVHTLLAPAFADGVHVVDEAVRNLGGKVFPAQEVVSGAFFTFQHIECLQGLLYIRVELFLLHKGFATFHIYFYHILFALVVSILQI